MINEAAADRTADDDLFAQTVLPRHIETLYMQDGSCQPSNCYILRLPDELLQAILVLLFRRACK